MALFNRDTMKMLGDFSTIGMTMSFSVFLGVGFGYFLDHKLFGGRTAPWFTLIFLGFGVAAAFLNIYRLAIRKELHDE